jgi:DNA-damage-inducible protein J
MLNIRSVVIMSQTNINIRIDEDLKRDFDAVCSELGLTMTTAFNVFAKAVTRAKAIPFKIAIEEDPFFSDENQARLLKAVEAYNAGKVWQEHELVEV